MKALTGIQESNTIASTYSNIYPKVSQKASNQIKTANNKGSMLSRKTFNLFLSQQHNKIRNHKVEQLESEKIHYTRSKQSTFQIHHNLMPLILIQLFYQFVWMINL